MNANFNGLSALASLAPEEIAASTQAVMRRVYLWMTAGLLVTALTSFAVLTSRTLLQFVAQFWLFFLIGELILVLVLSWAVSRLPVLAALGLFFGYAVLNGATLTLVILMYTAAQVLSAFIATACLFGALTIVGYTTKLDLTKLGSLLLMGLVGLIMGSVVNVFIANSAVDWILTFLGIAIFIGLTAYDTQRIKTMTVLALTQGGADVAALETSVGIRGALILYLDFINLFLRILRLFGRRR
ncbi:MAG: Bax inhibitor-1/YccA family protein [Anaerolineales bacterium]|nr:Bax inhibitor-1/YccA family protein [Anaerolineales bacterium]